MFSTTTPMTESDSQTTLVVQSAKRRLCLFCMRLGHIREFAPNANGQPSYECVRCVTDSVREKMWQVRLFVAGAEPAS